MVPINFNIKQDVAQQENGVLHFLAECGIRIPDSESDMSSDDGMEGNSGDKEEDCSDSE